MRYSRIPSLRLPGGISTLSVLRQHRANPCDEDVEVLHERAKKLCGAVVRDFAVIGDQPGRELDIGFRGVHLRRVAEAEHATQALLGNRGPDGAGRGADDRRRLARERVGAVGTARPIDRILQSPGYRAVIFRRDEQHGIDG